VTVDATERAEVERRVAAKLARAGVATPAADARWLVDHVVEVAGSCRGCGAALLDGLVARRVAREPVQLVVGRTWFRELELVCRAGVFVPRPETEVVAGLAIDAARRTPAAVVVEPCTGTGAIALAVATEVDGARVYAADVDDAAVALARENLDRVRAGTAGADLRAASVTLVAGPLLDAFPAALRGRVDVLVANPPYLPAADRGSWEPEVAAHDPDRALVGGPDGHEVVDELLALAPGWLAPGGTVVLEIDERRGAEAATVARDVGLVDVRVLPDLTGAERAVVARRPR
jgi:release factor glutamine methyltransferase